MSRPGCDIPMSTSNDLHISLGSLVDIHFFLYLSLVYLFPHFIFVYFGASSLAAGLVLLSSFILPVVFIEIVRATIPLPIVVLILISTIVLVLYAFYGYLSSGELKAFYSMSLMLLIVLAYKFFLFLDKLSFYSLMSTLNVFVIILFVMGWLSYFYGAPLHAYVDLEKPVFPFSEQSHYALSVGMFVVALISVCKIKMAFLYMGNLILQGILFPSLTLILFSFLCGLIIVFRARLVFALFWSIIFSFLFLSLVLYLFNYSDYFSSRLDFEAMENLTLLVWVQGWMIAATSLIETNALGVGFQVLGSSQTSLPHIANLIYDIYGAFYNVEDGGFLLAKFVSEFGIFAILLSSIYLLWCCSYIVSLHRKRRIAARQVFMASNLLNKEIIAGGLLFSFIVEYVFRGYGYFSPGLVIFIGALFYTLRRRSTCFYENCNYK
jgi:hypothetical protein